MTKNPLGCFSVLKDPRINRTKLYNLEAIIFQTVSAIISGCDSWNAGSLNRMLKGKIKQEIPARVLPMFV
ncbi:MAG: transposase family protein [Saccharospirillaceae bacterium]|nr:transposase family protein [Saccharospirillaceae bacterium]